MVLCVVGERLVHLGVIRVACTCCRGKSGGVSATRGRLFFDLSGTCSLCGCLLLLVIRIGHVTIHTIRATRGHCGELGINRRPSTGFVGGHFVRRLRVGGRLLSFQRGRGGD